MSPRHYLRRGFAKIRQISGSAISLFRLKDLYHKQNTHTGPANDKKNAPMLPVLERPLTLNNNDYWPITYFSNHHG